MTSRSFLIAGLLTALLVAGVASHYASSHPDGLNAVAAENGFSEAEKSSPTSKGPFVGYETDGVADDRLSGGIAGVAGSLTVLLFAGGLFWALRRRSPRPEDLGRATSHSEV